MGDIELQIFSERIKELRTSLNMTQKDFAAELGITASALSAYEKNSINPSISIAKRIAEKYHISLDWLCGLSDRKSANKVFKTYTDIIDVFFDIMNIGNLNVYPTKVYECDYTGFKQTMWGISFTDPELQEFLKDWKKMRQLYVTKTIDNEVYSLWIEKTIKKYDFPITTELSDEIIKYKNDITTDSEE